MTKLTAQDVESIADLREAGWSAARLGRRFGVSPGAINYQCLKQGAASPRQRRAERAEHSAIARRSTGVFVTFLAEEDRRLIDLEAEGIGYSEIARKMGRPRTSCRMRLMRLALDEEIEAREASHG